MRTIHKYPLEVTDEQTLLLPPHNILSVGEQDGHLVLWAMVDPTGNVHPVKVYVRGTGQPLDFDSGSYVGTVQMTTGLSAGLVWHVFAVGGVYYND